jgi:hypothetical protein
MLGMLAHIRFPMSAALAILALLFIRRSEGSWFREIINTGTLLMSIVPHAPGLEQKRETRFGVTILAAIWTLLNNLNRVRFYYWLWHHVYTLDQTTVFVNLTPDEKTLRARSMFFLIS